MNTIVNRIKQYIDFKQLAVSNVESVISVSNGTLSKAFNDNKTIKTDTLEKFLKHYTDISPNWLLLGDGEMIKLPSNIVADKISVLNAQERKLQEISLEKYQTEIKLLTEANSILKELLEELKFRIKTLETEIEQLKKEKSVKSGSVVVGPVEELKNK